ncbi:protein of unknown function UPF0047 [Coriobacterium glomerans PW2]|uniref:Secondary thiamine-phosphate synthase enzyme n=1 Tax=Coriobacterium glomerans (strain ATCC 49209 / DSM 20642 / JCM 10262 / PW2) TaxID=700015 RepID=F2N7K8_CORGP|nr:secondary thiamine-phosphate synthase enzyme YjbQ [Coriobacterium glomerans]AEB06824.1 protein of unknown function UPF0047 [Coriobacterium glomerans PW2]
MVEFKTLSYLSTKPTQFIDITGDIHDAVEASGIDKGLVAIILAHTTCGIVVNEGLSCVELDLSAALDRIAPAEEIYAHAHFLPSYGATGNNSCGHIKSMITGNSCLFPVMDGRVICGSAQNIYLAEFDGPQKRNVFVEIIGE